MESISKEAQKKVFSTEFKKFCRQSFYDELKKIENARRYYILAQILAPIICIPLSILFFLSPILMSLLDSSSNGVVSKSINLHFFYIFPIFIMLFVVCCAGKIYKTNAKKRVFKKLFSFIGDFQHYVSPEGNIDYVRTLRLFNRYNHHIFDDRIVGTYNSLSVDISEMHLSYHAKKTNRTVFLGILLTIPCNKKFNGATIIKLDGDSYFNKTGLEKVNLEDVEFERLYDAYSTDQIEARYLITPAFMKRMVQFANKGKKVALSFEHGNVNIAISSTKDMFEIPLYKSATDIAHYRAVLLELIAILKIIDSLKLEQNIGM